MIDVQLLRSKILALALSGNITKQCASDGDARILAKKIREKKGLKNKLENIEDNPYEIPSNWCWIRVSDFGTLSSGKPYEELDSGLLYVKVGDMNLPGNEKTITTSQHFVSESNTGIIQVNSIIFPKRGGAIATNKKRNVLDVPIFIDLNTMALTVDDAEIFPFVKLWFDSLDLAELQTGTSIPQINNKDIYPLLMPLPPLEEQKRIVDIVNNSFELLDDIENIQSQYSSDLEVLKSKIIDAGIQGKLTEHLPEDGTAEELLEQIAEEKKQLIKEKKIKATKALPEITKDEIPFEIPDNWKWVRLSEIMDVRDGTHDSPKYVEDGIPLVTSKNISSGGLDFSNVNYITQEDANKINERSNVDSGDILFAMIGTIGNPVIVEKEREFCIKNVALFKNFAKDKLDIRYVYWMLMREQFVMKKKAIGGLQPFISLKVFREYLVPLPPLEEQKRIADKLDEIISMC